MAEIIARTCAASGQHEFASIRYWLSAGYGNLSVTPSGCTSTFYVLVHTSLPFPKEWSSVGIADVTVPTSEVPMKPPFLAQVKCNNYLLNALVMMAAQERGGTFG